MPGDAKTQRPPLVLLAGAQEWSSRSFASILSPHGYAILRSYTDRQTIELARNASPDAVIVDVGLPEAGGLAVCSELRGDRGVPPSTPVVLIAPGAETRQQRLEALRAGASEFWGQPLDTDEVILRLEHLVAAKRDADRAWREGLTDQTTGLYNARGLEHRLREAHALAHRRHGPLACVVFSVAQPDLRRPAGVPRGPRVSELMAEALLASSRVSDVVARLGTSEYAVVASEADVAGAAVLAERLASVLARLATERGAAAVPPLRAGLDGFDDCSASGADPAELLERATVALQAAVPGDGTWLRRFSQDLN